MKCAPTLFSFACLLLTAPSCDGHLRAVADHEIEFRAGECGLGCSEVFDNYSRCCRPSCELEAAPNCVVACYAMADPNEEVAFDAPVPKHCVYDNDGTDWEDPNGKRSTYICE